MNLLLFSLPIKRINITQRNFIKDSYPVLKSKNVLKAKNTAGTESFTFKSVITMWYTFART